MEPAPSGAPHSTIALHFAGLKDPRVVGRSDHALLDILTIAILAVFCGAKGWEDIEHWAEDHAAWLQTFLRLPKGIPEPVNANETVSARNQGGSAGGVIACCVPARRRSR
jgi:hypothetical protein